MVEEKIVINIGSRNPVKIGAVREVISEYPFLNPFDLNSLEVSSEISEQPRGIEEIIKGAENRARNSFMICDYSIGLESGIFQTPYFKFVDMAVCSIYDGENFHYGFSEGFAVPPKLAKLINEEGLDLSQAAKKAGMTASNKIGYEKGIINILTNGRFVRADQIKSSLQMALISLENPDLYR